MGTPQNKRLLQIFTCFPVLYSFYTMRFYPSPPHTKSSRVRKKSLEHPAASKPPYSRRTRSTKHRVLPKPGSYRLSASSGALGPVRALEDTVITRVPQRRRVISSFFVGRVVACYFQSPECLTGSFPNTLRHVGQDLDLAL